MKKFNGKNYTEKLSEETLKEFEKLVPKKRQDVIDKLKKKVIERLENGREVEVHNYLGVQVAKVLYSNIENKWFLVEYENGLREGFKFCYIDIFLDPPFGESKRVNECSEYVMLRRTEEEKIEDKKIVEKEKEKVMKIAEETARAKVALF